MGAEGQLRGGHGRRSLGQRRGRCRGSSIGSSSSLLTAMTSTAGTVAGSVLRRGEHWRLSLRNSGEPPARRAGTASSTRSKLNRFLPGGHGGPTHGHAPGRAQDTSQSRRLSAPTTRSVCRCTTSLRISSVAPQGREVVEMGTPGRWPALRLAARLRLPDELPELARVCGQHVVDELAGATASGEALRNDDLGSSRAGLNPTRQRQWPED